MISTINYSGHLLGMAPEQVHARHPKLVVTSITGYGLDGEEAWRPGYDIGAFGRLRVTGVRCGRSARYRRRRPVVKGTYPPPRVVGSFGCVGD